MTASEGVHGTLRIGTAGTVTGTAKNSAVEGFSEFAADGWNHTILFNVKDRNVTFTPDPQTLPTKPLAVIETDNHALIAVLDRNGRWLCGGISFSPESMPRGFQRAPWHIVFPGVDE